MKRARRDGHISGNSNQPAKDMPDDNTLRPAEQIVLLTNHIQWLTTRMDKLSADFRVMEQSGVAEEQEYLDPDKIHRQNREKLQEIAYELRDVYESLGEYLNRRDAVSEAGADITSGTLDYLPPKPESFNGHE